MHLRFLIWFFLFHALGSFAQTPGIDSMRNRLPFIWGSEKVDCLNWLSGQFCQQWIHADSALSFSQAAYRQAIASNYPVGAAAALLMEAEIKGKLLGQPQQMEALSIKAIKILQSTGDKRRLCMASITRAGALVLQGKYSEAIGKARMTKQMAIELQDKKLAGWAAQTIGFAYVKSGAYWKAFEHLVEARQIGKQIQDSLLVSISVGFIARSFNRAGDPKKALEYYHEFLLYATPFALLWPHLEDMAYAHWQLQQTDSALYYQQKHLQNIHVITTDAALRKKFSGSLWGYSTDIQLSKKKYDSVLLQVLPLLSLIRNDGDMIPYMNALLIAGKAFWGKKDYPAALRHTRELYRLAANIDNKQFLKDAAQQLANTFERLHQSDSAYHYFRQYVVLNDSMQIAQYSSRTALYLAASGAESRISLLQKDHAMQQQQLVLTKKEIQRQVQLKKLIIAGCTLVVLCSLVIISNFILRRKNEKLRNEKEQSALKRKALELEMQALRAQMNPHFIFNCLSAIDSLIQTNQSDKATTCLSRFAKLVRGVLDGSKNNLVPFEKDFETVRLYLEMEQFRCNEKFIYNLHADQQLLQGDYKVPPLIIQPFIENAIHHGLLNKQTGSRRLDVNVQLSDKHIVYAITDNGVGRKRSAALRQLNKPDRQSYGIEITRERIVLHNKTDVESDLVITDLEAEGIALGTRAVVRIHCFG